MFIVSGDAPDEALASLSLKRDHVTAAKRDVTIDENWGFKGKQHMQALRVTSGHFPINISVNTRTPGDRLTVVLSAARKAAGQGDKGLLPQFQRRDWDALYGGPVLAISDPANELDWKSDVLRAGLYMGNFQHNLVPDIMAIVDKVCEETGVSKDRVVFTGGSVGGTAAILMATQRPVARALTTCAPTKLDRYRHVIAAGLQVMGGQLGDWQRIIDDEPWRIHPIVAIDRAVEQGKDVRIVMAQNLHDPATLKKQFDPFCTTHGIDSAVGGISTNGAIMALLYDDWEAGHGFESKEFSRAMWNRALQFFDHGT